MELMRMMPGTLKSEGDTRRARSTMSMDHGAMPATLQNACIYRRLSYLSYCAA